MKLHPTVKDKTLLTLGLNKTGNTRMLPAQERDWPNWPFKTNAIAEESSQKIFGLFEYYLKTGECVGADMARKYLQKSYTRACCYANYKSII